MYNDANPRASSNPFSRAKAILLSPHTEWPIIAAESATVGELYKNYILIMAAIPAIAGFITFGFRAAIRTQGVSLGSPLITFAIFIYVASLAGPLVLSVIVHALAPTFGAVKNYGQALKVATYAYTA